MTIQHPATESFAEIGASDAQRAGRVARGRLWAWAPALILGGLLGAQLVVLSRVLEDPGFALERDYYRKAVTWDAERARELQSRALGWDVSCEVTRVSQRWSLSIRLQDAQGRAVTGADVQVEAFHNARAGQVLTLSPREVAPGRYDAELDARRSGVWELRVAAKRGSAVFARVVRVELTPAEGS